MKGFDENGFIFYTNYDSRKGQELVCEVDFSIEMNRQFLLGTKPSCIDVFLLAIDVTISEFLIRFNE
jgi:hypothetical protein